MERKVILLVEDNKDELMIYTTLLSHQGYAMLTAADYESALRIAREQKPDLVIADVNLNDPARDGCDLVQALGEDPATRHLPVIAHTAFGDLYRRDLERVGCRHIVHKPGALVDMVRRLIGRPGSAGAQDVAEPATGD